MTSSEKAANWRWWKIVVGRVPQDSTRSLPCAYCATRIYGDYYAHPTTPNQPMHGECFDLSYAPKGAP